MSKLIERVDIDDTLYIYLQDNSKRWYARFVLFGKWYSKATKQKDKDKDKAIAMAHRLFLEHEIGINTNTLVQSKAKHFVLLLKNVLKAWNVSLNMVAENLPTKIISAPYVNTTSLISTAPM